MDKPLRHGAFTRERMYTRRMQCTYGWDWVARFLTSSMGECEVLGFDEIEIPEENVYITTLDVDDESATVRVDVSFPSEYGGKVFEFSVIDPDGGTCCEISKYCNEELVRLYFDIPNAKVWYPNGYGAQPLYTLTIKADGQALYSERFGIRTVKIMQLPDPKGSHNHELALSVKNCEYDFNEAFSGFVVKINGEKVFCRGANWVPCVPFACGNIDERQTEILELSARAGVNMLRVWGGGAFESKHFYSECSRLGIMVTQDFLMACGSYPEEEDWFIEELKKEAEYVVRLCRNQPCLMWWSGDNENAVGGSDTDENYCGRRSAYKGIAPVLYREDPYRRFLPSSPFGGRLYASNTVGTTHNTQFLGMLFKYITKNDLTDYKDELKKYRARFIAEEPQLGAASLPSLRRFMNDDDIFRDEEMWRYHMKTNPGLQMELYDYMVCMAEKVLGQFSDPQDKLFKLQYVQYEWMRVVMEQAKRERDFCSGIIFWMMNDCWPASAGWSLIDYYNIPKNAYYSFKRCAKPIIASVDHENGAYRVYVINDGDATAVKVNIKTLSGDRKSIKEFKSLNCIAKKYSSQLVFEGHDILQEGEILICDVESEFGKDRAFYRHGRLEIMPVGVNFAIDEKHHTITVSANEKYVHAVMISANAIFDDNCFSLMPFEARTISYQADEDCDDARLSVEAYTLV
jgi:beta-mannosidase